MQMRERSLPSAGKKGFHFDAEVLSGGFTIIMKTSIAVLILVCFHGLAAQRSEAPPHVLFTVRCPTNEMVFQISAARADALPKTGWHPESDLPPPVTLKQACLLAKASLKARLPEWDEFTVAQVDLHRIVGTEQWCYHVACGARKNGPLPVSGSSLCGITAVVLMDGTSVDPVITPTSP